MASEWKRLPAIVRCRSRYQPLFYPNYFVKEPQSVFPQVFAFPPNRKTLGGTAYLILEEAGNVLVDCPPWGQETADFLQQRGGVHWLFLTHRTAMAQVAALQAALDCIVVVQEQEAYLLPDLSCQSFRDGVSLGDRCQGFWTPGHSPGSACLYWAQEGGVLFSGRHLLPTTTGDPSPLRTSKTFHWTRQLQQVQGLLDRYNSQTLNHICPGASVGFLRGKRSCDRAYDRLKNLNWTALNQCPASADSSS